MTTKIYQLTENSKVEDGNLFVIYDGNRTVSVEGRVIKKFIAAGFFDDLPVGTKVSPPTVLTNGQPWLDVTDSTTDPILRVHQTPIV